MKVEYHDIVLTIVALVNVITALIAWRTNRVSTATQVLTKQVEVATNSMKDALVVAEKKVSFTEGREDMRAEGESSGGD